MSNTFRALVLGRRRALSVVVSLAVGLLAGLTLAVGTAPGASAAGETLSQAGSASTAGNRASHQVTIPSTVQPGDSLVLVLTWNSASTATGPSGWTQLQAYNGNKFSARAWTRVATGADAGSTVTVTTAAKAKSVMSVAAYRSSGGRANVTASAVAGSNTGGTSHATPQVAVGQENSWLVNAWSEKSASATTWTLPGGVTQRTTAAATGTGKVSGVLGDSNGAVPTGTAAARTATTSTSVGRSAMFSLVVTPGTSTNKIPTASFIASCSLLVCGMDASGSSDPDGNPLTYSWNFGDNTTGTGVSPSHTYASTGTRTVTLTVSDGTDTDVTTRSVTVSNTGPGTQPKPNHTTLVPDTANTTMPRISQGEIWDIEVVGNRAFVAGGFTSLQNRTSTNTNTVNQAYLAAFNLNTGLIDTTFRPTFGGGEVNAVEASPDGTKLYVGGTFNTVNGVTKRKVASLNLTTGAPVAGFTADAGALVNSLAASNTTLYIGGRFSTINGQTMVGLAAVNGATGALDTGFDNQLSGGIGTNGTLTVQQLKLTHDSSKLLVVHTARKIDGQDRYGVGLIDTASKQLLPWRTRLWEDNLQYVGGIQRIYGGDIAPDDSFFVVSSGSGGDRPPINDTAVAFRFDGGDNVQPMWISRAFDSVYSVAITEKAVYIGGHFQWNESPTAPDPWPGLDNVGYGTGQGLSAYALGDAVVRRDHLGALDPATGKALEWHPGSNSFEGNKAMEATSRGLLAGGDANRQGGANVGRVAFFDLNQLPAASNPDTTITSPIQGRVEPTNQQFTLEGSATSTAALARVEITVKDGNQYLQDNLTTWSGTVNSVNAQLGTRTGSTTPWSLPLTVSGAREMEVRARAVATGGAQDPVQATKKIESFSFDDLPPNTSISGPGSLQTTTSFVLRGSASDDKGVSSVILYVRDSDGQYLDGNGNLNPDYTTFRIDPDNPGAVNTTWQYQLNLPHEGAWKIQAMATDNAGQNDIRWATADYTVSSTGKAPTVTVGQPVAVTPPTTPPTLTMAPGGRVTFSGTAVDDQALATVEVSLRNSTTRENLAADGTWGADVIAGWYKVSPANLSAASYNWSYTMPADLVPGSYSFQVRATDKQDLTTSSSLQGRVNINVAVPGDAPPNGLLSTTGTITSDVRHLDLAGTATDDFGVKQVRVSVYENDTDRYIKPNGTLGAGFATLNAVLASPNATSTGWTLPVDLPTNGSYSVTAYAVDTSDQLDPSTTGATARYNVYPGDAPPELAENLFSPTEGTAFTDARIFVSGRAVDDLSIARVEVAIVNAAGQYMSSSGTFSTTERWTAAFLNSPGSAGSNYSYTTPIIPDGAYKVRVRPVDNHGLFPLYREVNVTVSAPAGNAAPVAVASVSCAQNVCTFDGRGSTDENTSTLTYSWTYGNGRTGSGALPTVTYTGPGTFTPTLTVRDEYGLTSTVTMNPLTITEPPGNAAPTAVISPPTCVGLVCNFSGATSSDPNTGDTFTYLWSFGDGGATSTSSSPSKTYAAAGTYTVALTVTDGWGRSSVATRTVTVSP